MPNFDARFSRKLEGLLDHALGILEAALDDPAVPVEKRRALALRRLELGTDQAAPAVPVTLPVEFVTIPQFLPPELHRDVVTFAETQRDRLQPSRVSGTDETVGRVLTFVIYFELREPRGFDGGVLRVYQTDLDAEGRTRQHRPDVFRELAPDDNMIVFFDSRLSHEVLPVRVPSGACEDGRFTLNGWLHQSEQEVEARVARP